MPMQPKPVKAHNEELDLTLYFNKAKHAATHLGCDASIIAKVCRGKLVSSWGWVFEFLDPNEVVTFVPEEEKPLIYEKKKTPWNKGKKGVYSEEIRDKMGAPKRGKKASEEAKKKMSLAHKKYYQNNPHPNQGRKLPASHKENISKGVRDSAIIQATFTKESFRSWCESRNIELLDIHDDNPDYLRQHSEVTKRCNNSDCSRKHKTAIYRLVRGEGVLCGRCSGKLSAAELNLANFLKENGFTPEMNAKPEFIAPKELDLYLPEKKFAIEYHGLIFHSARRNDNYATKTRHEEKYALCKEQGIRLIQIFEDEWKEKPNIVYSMLRSKLGILPIKVPARKCEVVQITAKEAKEFFNTNHIAGYASAKITFALKYDGKTITALSLRKPFTAGKAGTIEICRFASAIDTSIIGGFSRLFKYASDWSRSEGFQAMLTYADCRWGSGEVYEKIGFTHMGKTKPNYFYENGKVREPRFQHRKNNDPEYIAQHGTTEKQQNHNQGWFEIYDAGSEIYLLKL